MGKKNIDNCAVHKKIGQIWQVFVVFSDVFPGHRTLFRIYEDSINVCWVNKSIN